MRVLCLGSLAERALPAVHTIWRKLHGRSMLPGLQA